VRHVFRYKIQKYLKTMRYKMPILLPMSVLCEFEDSAETFRFRGISKMRRFDGCLQMNRGARAIRATN